MKVGEGMGKGTILEFEKVGARHDRSETKGSTGEQGRRKAPDRGKPYPPLRIQTARHDLYGFKQQGTTSTNSNSFLVDNT